MNMDLRVERTQLLERITAFLLFVAVAVFLTVGNRVHSLHPEVRFLAVYSPERFIHGLIQTVVFSAVFVPRMRLVGTTTLIAIGILLPYFLMVGVVKTLRMYFIPHIVATLAVAAVLFLGAGLGWHWAHVMLIRKDIGASCGLAAVTTGLGLVLWRRWVIAGAAIFTALALIYTYEVLFMPSLTAVEHVLAIGTALALGMLWA